MEQARRTGRLPDRVANAPQLDPGLELFWVAYCDLSTCRPASMGDLAPIPWTAVDQWATKFKLDDEQEERLHFIVGKMDKAMIAWEKKKSGNKSKSGRAGRKARGGRGWRPRGGR